jgi:protein phosphatase
MDFYSITDRGKIRKTNEDSICVESRNGFYMAAVADGLGGENAGDYASSETVNSLKIFFSENRIPNEKNTAELVRQISSKIYNLGLSKKNLNGMGTTLTAFFTDSKKLVWVHSGDSRLWLFRKNKLIQITNDHRFIQDLIDDHTISQEEADVHPMKNLLDQCVGTPECAPDTGTLNLETGDFIILSSDGLHDFISGDQIQKTIKDSLSPEIICKNLLNLALEVGGKDNISVICSKV